jgi:gamma-glutamyltranspeptidase / glutathione hydrolase
MIDSAPSPMTGRRPTVSSMNGIAAAAHPHAAAAGACILSQGGTAFDAAVAIAAALNVVEPYMSSFAGMGLATCWIAKEQRVRTLNFVPRIPQQFPVQRFSARDDLARGAMSVGTPGNLAGWAELMRAYGRMSFKDTLAPAIALARDGYPVTEFNVLESNVTAPEIEAHVALVGPWRKNYTDGSGYLKPGYVLRQPELARTFETIAAEGAGYLYGGALGRAMVQHLQDNGGCLTEADLLGVKLAWIDPATVRYRDLAVSTPPPPCEGFQFLLTLRILDGFDLSLLPRNGVEHIDLVWRAIRVAAGERIAHNNPTHAQLAELMSDAHVERLRARVRDGRPIVGPTEQWTAPQPSAKAAQHTTSFSVADRDGNLVCVTQSLGSPYGSAVLVPGTGVMLNNFLYWADVQPDSPNRSVAGGVLPMCMSPSISLRDGKPALALGTPGSYGIMQTQVQALVQHVDFGLSPQDAIEAPRGRLMDGCYVYAENRIEKSVLDELKARGHEIEVGDPWSMKAGGMHGIAIDPVTGAKTGGCDPRRDGYVVPA